MAPRLIRVILTIGLLLIQAVFILAVMGSSTFLFGQKTPAPYVKSQFFTSAGVPLASGKLCTFQAGTSTPLTSYSNTAGTSNTNPVVLDSAGRADIFLTNGTPYKLILYAAGGDSNCPNSAATIWTEDNITAGSAVTVSSGTTNRVAKYTSASALGNSSIYDGYSGENIRIQADGTVSIGTTADLATELYVKSAATYVASMESTTSTATVTFIGTGGLYGQLAANATEFDMCSATGPCASGFGVFPSYTTAFGTNVTPLRVISGATTSGMSIYTGTSVFSGSLVATSSELDMCSAAGPCNSGFSTFATYTSTFGAGDTYGFRVISTATTAGIATYTSGPTYRGGLVSNSTIISLVSGTGPAQSYLGVAATYLQTTAPSAGSPGTPASATYRIYVDTSDSNKLKAVGPSGTVTTLANP